MELQNHIRKSKLILWFLLCLDNVFIITTMMEMALHYDTFQLRVYKHIYISKISILVVFSISLLVDGIALVGVVKTKKFLLIPWLIVYMIFNIILMIGFFWDVVTNTMTFTRINHAGLILVLMCIWRAMQVTFTKMENHEEEEEEEEEH